MSNNSNGNVHKTQGQTTLMYNLGKMRNTIASTTRKHKFCSKNSNSSEAIICTFNIGSQTNQTEIILKPPIILSIIDGNGSATVSFEIKEANMDSIIDYLYSLDGINYISVGQVTSPIIINGLQNGINYTITLKAVYQNGTSASSNAVSVIPSTIPEPPRILTAIAGDGEIDIDFIKGFNGGSPIIDYLYSIDGINYISMGNISAPIKLTGLTNGKIYNITLKSVNKNGESDSSLSISLMPSGLPYPPQITNFVAGNGEATINFIDGFNNGTTIIGYLYSIDGVNYISTTSNNNSIKITGLQNGITYNITLKSKNKNGQSSPSNSVSVTPNNLGPLAPVLIRTTQKTLNSLTIEFTQEQNEFTITNYKYSINGGQYISLLPVKTSSPITITDLSPGTNYNIQLRGVSSVGDGKESNILNDTTYIRLNLDTFKNIGLSTWKAPGNTTLVEYLIVGGGGGGGSSFDTGSGGGGGAGLALTGSKSVTPNATYNVYVGSGGAGGTANRTTSSELPGSTGEASYFDSIIAPGGIGGYGSRTAPGGVGLGGAKADPDTLTPGQGGNGGGSAGSAASAGGGGGNGGAGRTSTTNAPGLGGVGISIDITGTPVIYGAGGTGGRDNVNSDGANALPNTGNGGVGASSIPVDSSRGGNGGSGIVILKYYM